MVTDLVGAHCDKVVACAYIRPDWPHKDPAELCMEATLLVVEDPAAAEEKEGEAPAILASSFPVSKCTHKSRCCGTHQVVQHILCRLLLNQCPRPKDNNLQMLSGSSHLNSRPACLCASRLPLWAHPSIAPRCSHCWWTAHLLWSYTLPGFSSPCLPCM
jgi:hypothetical protein